MVSRKASAPKRAAATQKLTKKAATATEKAKTKAKASKSKTNAAVKAPKKAEPARADASALATTSGTAATDKHSDRGKVLYVGHLPHGFYEEQLRGYFSQFGAVTRVRLSRVKKTGKPKSYAFLEFANPAVAAIAADAMDGYLMFSQRLSVKVLGPEAVHPTLFRGANRTFTKVPWKKLEANRVNRKLTPSEAAKRASRAARADAKRAERIKKAGIEYEYKRLLESILSGEEDDKPKEKKAAAAGKKKSEAVATVGVEEASSKPAKKAKTATTKAAPAAKKPAAAKKAAADAPAAKKTKRGPAAASAPTRSSKRARG